MMMAMIMAVMLLMRVAMIVVTDMNMIITLAGFTEHSPFVS